MPLRRRVAGQDDQVGLAPVIQLPAPVGLGMVLQNPRQPFFGISVTLSGEATGRQS